MMTSHNARPKAKASGRSTMSRTMAFTAAASLIVGLGTGTVASLVMRSGTSSAAATMINAGTSGGANTMSYDYSGTYNAALTADGESVTSDSETTTATDSDQNASLATNGGTLAITNGTLEKSGNSDNADNNNFYGTNSVLLAVGDGSKATISDSSINATSSGSNGIFSTDSATVYANNTSITTSADNSRGLDATYSGTIIGNNLTISTQGDHSAAIATDRGGGSVSVTNSKLSTAGSGSPLLYSTGDVQVSGVTGTATGAQIAGMEGMNTILINDSTLESTNTSTTGSDPIANGIIIYQSTSGDAESSTGEHATFQAKDSTLKSDITSGSMFYFTNTSANVVLQNTTLDFDSDAASLITAAGNDSNNWGQSGSNGATVNFTGRNQTLNGDIDVDTISSVTLNLLEGSTWTGSATITENSAGSTVDEPLTINVDGTSTWTVTKDTTVSNMNVAEGGKVMDSSGRTVTIVANGKTVVQGDSDITVTVTGSYGTTVTADDETQLSKDLINRSDFDSTFGTTTTWSL
ncbi:beta strand repeat-containing protein [Bifidobacterium tsurumiense]|uniref:Adhesin n=1 Tax=Bifidobacterium tsurumiense TaxID=356829 RepID=A0A087ECQ8_9BIFI|nr:adhesin [Bifidobacterium tsurumiense]KFJ05559.1 hypothetical protein BITS_0242 [Bifidobacterium tsurumiense]MDY4678508.1 adhesin [Bifidobacterium tsurumiense]